MIAISMRTPHKTLMIWTEVGRRSRKACYGSIIMLLGMDVLSVTSKCLIARPLYL